MQNSTKPLDKVIHKDVFRTPVVPKAKSSTISSNSLLGLQTPDNNAMSTPPQLLFSKELVSPFMLPQNSDWSKLIGTNLELPTPTKMTSESSSELKIRSHYKHRGVAICEGTGNARYEVGYVSHY